MSRRVNNDQHCCANCAYFTGERQIDRHWVEVKDENHAYDCGNRSHNYGKWNCFHGNCSGYEQHPATK